MNYESWLERESRTTPGVTFVLAKMSFGRRIELMRRLREIAQKVEFLEAGDAREKIEAALLTSEIDRLYVMWGSKRCEAWSWTEIQPRPSCWLQPGRKNSSERRWPP